MAMPVGLGVLGGSLTSAANAYLEGLFEPSLAEVRAEREQKARAAEEKIHLDRAHALYYGRPQKGSARPLKVGNKVVWVDENGADVIFEGPEKDPDPQKAHQADVRTAMEKFIGHPPPYTYAELNLPEMRSMNDMLNKASDIAQFGGQAGGLSPKSNIRDFDEWTKLGRPGGDTDAAFLAWQRQRQSGAAAPPAPAAPPSGTTTADTAQRQEPGKTAAPPERPRTAPPILREGLQRIADSTGARVEDLDQVIGFETGGSYSPSVRNSRSGATGYIQFTKDTAERMGTTVDNLARMSPDEQLTMVERYLLPYKGKIGNLQDLYLAIFAPNAIGKSGDTVLYSAKGQPLAYEQNSQLDKNKKGYITVADASAAVQNWGGGAARAPSQTVPPKIGGEAIGVWRQMYEGLSEQEIQADKWQMERLPPSPVRDARLTAIEQVLTARTGGTTTTTPPAPSSGTGPTAQPEPQPVATGPAAPTQPTPSPPTTAAPPVVRPAPTQEMKDKAKREEEELNIKQQTLDLNKQTADWTRNFEQGKADIAIRTADRLDKEPATKALGEAMKKRLVDLDEAAFVATKMEDTFGLMENLITSKDSVYGNSREAWMRVGAYEWGMAPGDQRARQTVELRNFASLLTLAYGSLGSNVSNEDRETYARAQGNMQAATDVKQMLEHMQTMRSVIKRTYARANFTRQYVEKNGRLPAVGEERIATEADIQKTMANPKYHGKSREQVIEILKKNHFTVPAQ